MRVLYQEESQSLELNDDESIVTVESQMSTTTRAQRKTELKVLSKANFDACWSLWH